MGTFKYLVLALVTSLFVMGCNKDEKTAATPGPAPLPVPPPNAPATHPGNTIITPSDIVFDNSMGLPTTIVLDPLFSKTFTVRNYNSMTMPYAPDKKLEGNQWVEVGPEGLVHLFAPCVGGSFGGGFKNSCLTNDAAEMRFQFDGSGVLNFMARINQVDYKAIRIPYEFNGNTGYLKIARFFATSRGGVKSHRDVIAIEPERIVGEKVFIDTIGGGRVTALGADLVDLLASKGTAPKDLSLRAGFRFESRLKLRYGKILPQAVPALMGQGSWPGPMASPTPIQPNVPALPPIRVFKSINDFKFFDTRSIPDPVLLVPVR